MTEYPLQTIKVTVCTNKVGSESTTTFEIDADATDAEIEEAAKEVMHDRIEWWWDKVQKKGNQ